MKTKMIVVMMLVVSTLSHSGDQKRLNREKSIPTGVILSRKPLAIERAWSLENNLKWTESDFVRKEGQKEINKVLEDLSDNAYCVKSSGNIRQFNNEFTDIYFVPEFGRKGSNGFTKLYGAILFEEEGFRGKSQIIYKHFSPCGVFVAEHGKITIPKVSSVRLFMPLW